MTQMDSTNPNEWFCEGCLQNFPNSEPFMDCENGCAFCSNCLEQKQIIITTLRDDPYIKQEDCPKCVANKSYLLKGKLFTKHQIQDYKKLFKQEYNYFKHHPRSIWDLQMYDCLDDFICSLSENLEDETIHNLNVWEIEMIYKVYIHQLRDTDIVFVENY